MKRMYSPSMKSTLIAVNAALYAGLGLLTYFGIFAPIVGVVRFWGIAVIIPAVFAAVFGPLIGGFGAVIGIFITDMIIHGNALLSLTVGVPANLAMFMIIGFLTTKRLSSKVWIATAGSTIVILYTLMWLIGASELSVLILGLFTSLIFVIFILIYLFWKEITSFTISAIIGNTVGSFIVGFGVWAYSQFLTLPMSMGEQLPIATAIIWFTWTFANQMPFLLVIAPPIITAIQRALFSRVTLSTTIPERID